MGLFGFLRKNKKVRNVTIEHDGDTYEFKWLWDGKNERAQFQTAKGVALADITHAKPTPNPGSECGENFPNRWIITFWTGEGNGRSDPWSRLRERFVHDNFGWNKKKTTYETLEETVSIVEGAIKELLELGWQNKNDTRGVQQEMDTFFTKENGHDDKNG